MLTWPAVIVALGLPANTAPVKSYMLVSATFIGAQFFSFHALLYVSYPTQVLAKSCKPIPVMLMGLVVMKRTYPLAKYLFVTLMCAGIIMFSYNPVRGHWSQASLPLSHMLNLTTTHKSSSNRKICWPPSPECSPTLLPP